MDFLFDHEQLDVYRVARELNREIAGIIAELPRGAGEAADNLRRAGASITRNLAEANGKWTGPDKAQRWHIARGSAMETGASLDELVDFGFVAPGRVTRAKSHASRVVAMLVGLIRALPSADVSGKAATPAPRKPAASEPGGSRRAASEPGGGKRAATRSARTNQPQDRTANEPTSSRACDRARDRARDRQ